MQKLGLQKKNTLKSITKLCLKKQTPQRGCFFYHSLYNAKSDSKSSLVVGGNMKKIVIPRSEFLNYSKTVDGLSPRTLANFFIRLLENHEVLYLSQQFSGTIITELLKISMPGFLGKTPPVPTIVINIEHLEDEILSDIIKMVNQVREESNNDLTSVFRLMYLALNDIGLLLTTGATIRYSDNSEWEDESYKEVKTTLLGSLMTM